MKVSKDPECITKSHGSLPMSTVVLFVVPEIILYVTPNSSTVESVEDPGDDVFGLLCVLLPLIWNFFWMPLYDKGQFKGLEFYCMENSATVILAYAFLLKINLQYCILVPFPITLVAFITHLCQEFRVQHGSGSEDNKNIKKSEKPVGAPTDPCRSDNGCEKESMQIGELDRTVVIIPFFMLLFCAIYGDSIPVLSHFLLFSCCALGRLSLLYSRLADEVSPALKPARDCIQMSYMVMLFITVHTLATEWLGEVTVLVCIPELITGLVWFSSLLHSDTPNWASDKVTSDKETISADGSDETEVSRGKVKTEHDSVGIFKGFIFHGSMFIPLGAVLAGLTTSTYPYDWELLSSWNTKATVACGIAGCMPYLSVWMVSRWPGSIPSSDRATQLLKFLANICLTGSCLMLPALLAEKTLAYRLFSLDGLADPSVVKYLPIIYFSTAVAWLGAFFFLFLKEGWELSL